MSSILGTVITAAILIAVIGLIIMSLVNDKKKGKCSCGSSCGHCPNSGLCHSQTARENKIT